MTQIARVAVDNWSAPKGTKCSYCKKGITKRQGYHYSSASDEYLHNECHAHYLDDLSSGLTNYSGRNKRFWKQTPMQNKESFIRRRKRKAKF